MRRYVVTVIREGDTWLGTVKGLPGAHTYARTLARLRSEMVDVIILSPTCPTTRPSMSSWSLGTLSLDPWMR